MLSGRKRRARLRELSPGFGLSFVDTVSGGFGAAFFLFLIFASLPVESPALLVGGGARFIEVKLEWDPGPVRMEIYLDVNGGTQTIRLSSRSFDVDGETGILSHRSGPLPFWERGTTSGFSWFGPSAMVEMGADRSNALRFRLVNPCGVTLRIGAAIHGTSRGLDWLEQVSQAATNAKLTVIQSGQNGAREVYEGEFDVADSVNYPDTLTRNGQVVDPTIVIPPPQDETVRCRP